MQRVTWLLTGLVLVVGAGIGLGLTVVPFGYGAVESTVLACAFILLALYQTVLDDAFTEP